MAGSGIGVLDLAEQRLAWLDRRQTVLSQNVANADTPGWRPRDLTDFAATLSGTLAAPLATTRANHIGAASPDAVQARPQEIDARAPDGNAVSVEKQLMKVAETESAQELASNIYTKYVGFFRLALGRGQ